MQLVRQTGDNCPSWIPASIELLYIWSPLKCTHMLLGKDFVEILGSDSIVCQTVVLSKFPPPKVVWYNTDSPPHNCTWRQLDLGCCLWLLQKKKCPCSLVISLKSCIRNRTQHTVKLQQIYVSQPMIIYEVVKANRTQIRRFTWP